MKLISLSRLEKTMRPKEMKNILGGSSFCNGYPCVCYCKRSNKYCSNSESDCESLCAGYGGVDWYACG